MFSFTGHLCKHTHNTQLRAKITAVLEAEGGSLKLALFSEATLQNTHTHTAAHTHTHTAAQCTAAEPVGKMRILKCATSLPQVLPDLCQLLLLW